MRTEGAGERAGARADGRAWEPKIILAECVGGVGWREGKKQREKRGKLKKEKKKRKLRQSGTVRLQGQRDEEEDDARQMSSRRRQRFG